MEKLIYVLWRDPAQHNEAGAIALRHEMSAALRTIDKVHGAQLNIVDDAVTPAAALRQIATSPPPDAFVQLWVDSAVAQFRAPIDALIKKHCVRSASYLVCESQPLPNRLHPPKSGERTHGFAQIALLRRPTRLTANEWLNIWHNSHTTIAIETQSNFEYTQNLIVRALRDDDANGWDAIVEESFPPEAMTDPYVFFDAAGDEAKFQRNLKAMMDSVQRFIDLAEITVVPTSQYRLLAR